MKGSEDSSDLYRHVVDLLENQVASTRGPARLASSDIGI